MSSEADELSALAEARRERDEARATVRRAMTAIKDGAQTAAAVALAICSKGDGQPDIFDQLAEAQRREELMRPVVEAVGEWRRAELPPDAHNKVYRALNALAIAYDAYAHPEDTYETQEGTE